MRWIMQWVNTGKSRAGIAEAQRQRRYAPTHNTTGPMNDELESHLTRIYTKNGQLVERTSLDHRLQTRLMSASQHLSPQQEVRTNRPLVYRWSTWLQHPASATVLVCLTIVATGLVLASTSLMRPTALRTAALPLPATVAVHGAQGSLSLTVTNGTSTGQFRLSPAAPFHMAELVPIPSGLTQSLFTYIPGAQPGSGPGATIIAGDSSLDTQATHERIMQLASQSTPTLWLYFASPQGNAMDIVEQPAPSGYSLPSGETTTIGSTPAVIQQEGNQTTVTLNQLGTTITLQTNLGRTAAVQAAGGLTWH